MDPFLFSFHQTHPWGQNDLSCMADSGQPTGSSGASIYLKTEYGTAGLRAGERWGQQSEERCQHQLLSRNGRWKANAAGVESLKDMRGAQRRHVLLVQVPGLGTPCHPGLWPTVFPNGLQHRSCHEGAHEPVDLSDTS